MSLRNRTMQGFTLMEVLIALTLLSIMVTLLFTSLKICADSWEKGENKIAEVDEVGIVYNFFQRHLSASRPLWNDFSGENSSFSFQGKAQALQFVSALPASAGKPGLQLFSLYLEEEKDERVIKVELTPFFPVAEGQEWHREEAVLIRGVSNFDLAYFGSEDGISDPSWQHEWLEKQVQPRLVKINIELENGIFWPEMIIELKVAATDGNADENTLAPQQEEQ